MKNLITLLFLTFCFSGFSQNLDDIFERFPSLIPNSKESPEKVESRGPDDFVKDSTYTYFFSTIIEDYDLKNRTIYEYNSEGKIILESLFNWDDINQTFFDKSKTHYLYDDENHLIEKWTENFYSPIWQNGLRSIYVYENNLLVEELFQNWNSNSGEWVNKERLLISFNSDGLTSEATYQLWDSYSADFFNSYRLLYTYNDNGQVDFFQTELWYYETWNAWEKYYYFYDADGNNNLSQLQVWDGYDWHLSEQDFMTYNDQNNLVESISQSWDIDSLYWKNVYKYTYEYDGSNNQIMTLVEYFTSEWNLSSKAEYSFDSNNNRIQELGFYYESNYEPFGWNPTYRRDHFWGENTPSSILEVTSNEIECKYPNPFIQGNEINCVLENGKDYEFSIFDIQGRMIYHRNMLGNSSLSLDQELAKGVYILTIQDERNIVYRDKLIIH